MNLVSPPHAWRAVSAPPARSRPLAHIIFPAVVAFAVLICYAPVVRGLIGQWSTDPEMGHAFFVPLAALWIVWRERPRWRTLDPRPSLWGFVLLGVGAAFYIASAAGAGLFAGALGFLITIAGVVLALAGKEYLRTWSLPLLLLLFMLPRLAIVYNQFTLPLQLAASRLAAGALGIFHIPVVLDGNLLRLRGQTFFVDEECSGLHSLLSLGFLAVLYAYYVDGKPWMRTALLAAVTPLSIGANALRVAATVLLGSVNPVLARGACHTLCGVLVFIACLPAVAGMRSLFNYLHARLDA